MRYRDHKQFIAGHYYHVFNRGNNKQVIFKEAEDFIFFLRRLRENILPEQSISQLGQEREKSRQIYVRKLLPAGSFSLICYCLMPNHFHFLIRQNGDIPINKLIQKVCTSYSIYYNKKYDCVGNVLQAKFKAIVVDKDAYLIWLSAYIHQNPKTAGLVDKLDDYEWSSYLDYLGERNGSLCSKEIILNQFKNAREYRQFVEESYIDIQRRKNVEHLLLDE